MIKQQILTPDCGHILAALIDLQRTGARIVSVSPHYNHAAMLIGYLVIAEREEKE